MPCRIRRGAEAAHSSARRPRGDTGTAPLPRHGTSGAAADECFRYTARTGVRPTLRPQTGQGGTGVSAMVHARSFNHHAATEGGPLLADGHSSQLEIILGEVGLTRHPTADASQARVSHEEPRPG